MHFRIREVSKGFEKEKVGKSTLPKEVKGLMVRRLCAEGEGCAELISEGGGDEKGQRTYGLSRVSIFFYWDKLLLVVPIACENFMIRKFMVSCSLWKY